MHHTVTAPPGAVTGLDGSWSRQGLERLPGAVSSQERPSQFRGPCIHSKFWGRHANRAEMAAGAKLADAASQSKAVKLPRGRTKRIHLVWHGLRILGVPVDGRDAAVGAVGPVQDSALTTNPATLIALRCQVGPTSARHPKSAVHGCAERPACRLSCSTSTLQHDTWVAGTHAQ